MSIQKKNINFAGVTNYNINNMKVYANPQKTFGSWLMLIVMATLLLAPNPHSAASAQSKKKRPAATVKGGTTAGKGKTTAAKGKASQKQKAAAPKTTTFEGALLYRSYEYHSGVVRKFSNGHAYNGERTTLVKMSGQDVHIVDEAMHLHTVIVSAEGRVYLYSDVLPWGLQGDKKFLQQFLGAYDPSYNLPDMPKTSTMRTTGEEVTYKGDRCRVYSGQLKMGDAGETDVELWYSPRLKTNANHKYFVWGIPVDGVIRKGIINNSGSVPLLGKLKSTIALELMALTQYKVSASEMRPPSSIRMKIADAKLLNNFYDENTKALKKAKLYPKKLSGKDAKLQLRQQWDFADEWLAKEFKPQTEQITWAKVGQMLFDTAVQITQAIKEIRDTWDNKDELQQLLPEGGDDLLYVGCDMADNSGMIPIDRLIARLEQQIGPYRQTLAAKDAKSAEIASRPKEKKIINGKVMYLTSKKNLLEAGSLWKNTERSSTIFVVREWEARIEHLRELQQRGQTHISKEAWLNYIGVRTKKQKKDHENTMNRLYRMGYDQGVKNARTFKDMDEYDLDYARSLRDYMRKERESSTQGIKKSILEDWLDNLLK